LLEIEKKKALISVPQSGERVSRENHTRWHVSGARNKIKNIKNKTELCPDNCSVVG
jgi:hypothetical protein